MKYRIDYKPLAIDLWKLSMYGIYGSMIGVVNIVFTVAMFLLAARFWGDINSFLRIILIIGICLFIFIQPITIYFRAKKQIVGIPEDMEIGFDDKGMYIFTSNQKTKLYWNKINKIIKKSNIIIIFVASNQGFIITDKMLGSEKEDFYNYIFTRIK